MSSVKVLKITLFKNTWFFPSQVQDVHQCSSRRAEEQLSSLQGRHICCSVSERMLSLWIPEKIAHLNTFMCSTSSASETAGFSFTILFCEVCTAEPWPASCRSERLLSCFAHCESLRAKTDQIKQDYIWDKLSMQGCGGGSKDITTVKWGLTGFFSQQWPTSWTISHLLHITVHYFIKKSVISKVSDAKTVRQSPTSQLLP